MVAKTAGEYTFADMVTIADACLVPQVYNGYRFGVDMKKFPRILQIYDALMQLDAFKNTHSSLQPDFPEKEVVH
ncbi:unnamed protein product [Soboliphyme baturini]|uniref:GST C-terminal domain-containing protein n=1 Tax=Soboliphyme baturini TaxID=241478 RepID=A0A183IAE0_9BILA|nr:unnamed protein product [Soboliphyme baturini]